MKFLYPEHGVIDWRDEALPATVTEIVAAYDARHAAAVRRLSALTPSIWERDVGLTVAGQEYRRMPGYAWGWEFLFDQVHQRGQLSTYLRPMGATVPSIIGPSADEAL